MKQSDSIFDVYFHGNCLMDVCIENCDDNGIQTKVWNKQILSFKSSSDFLLNSLLPAQREENYVT